MADIEYVDATAAASESPEEAVVDASVASPHGVPCDACGAPVEPQDKFCPACGSSHQIEPLITAQAVDQPLVIDEDSAEPPAQKHFRCDNCGSEVATDPDQRSYVCAFCDSTYVAEFSPVRSGRQRPEFVIGFAVTPDQARAKFDHWIQQNAWFRPGDLKTAAVAEKQRGVYLPFWSFSMLADSRWSATIGEYWYRTETYTTTDSKGRMVTRTRQVRETEWWPLEGQHHRYYSGYLVSGSKGLSQRDAERIKPFHLPALKRYEPYFLAGWLAEEYSVERAEALKICEHEFYAREGRNIQAFLPGDTSRNVEVFTSFSNVNSDLCLLPVYVLSYRYKETIYRFLVNGQTGQVAGDKPTSKARVGILVGVVVGLIALIVILILIFANA